MLKRFAVLVIAALFAAAVPAAVDASDIKADDFTLNDLSGKSVSLSDFKGRAVVLNFWATWCPPCRAEMPEFAELDEELKKSGDAVLLSINMTDGKRETAQRVKDFVGKNGYKITVLLDEGCLTAQKYGVRYLPTTVVINPRGMMSGAVVGGTTKEAVLALVEEAWIRK